MVNPLFPRQGDLVFTFFSRSQLGNKPIYLWSKLSIPQKGISYFMEMNGCCPVKKAWYRASSYFNDTGVSEPRVNCNLHEQ